MVLCLFGCLCRLINKRRIECKKEEQEWWNQDFLKKRRKRSRLSLLESGLKCWREERLAWKINAMALIEENWAERKQARNWPANIAGHGMHAAAWQVRKPKLGYFENTGRGIGNVEPRPAWEKLGFLRFNCVIRKKEAVFGWWFSIDPQERVWTEFWHCFEGFLQIFIGVFLLLFS